MGTIFYLITTLAYVNSLRLVPLRPFPPPTPSRLPSELEPSLTPHLDLGRLGEQIVPTRKSVLLSNKL